MVCFGRTWKGYLEYSCSVGGWKVVEWLILEVFGGGVGGERGIRTLGTGIPVQQISNLPLSATQSSLRAQGELGGRRGIRTPGTCVQRFSRPPV